jgi:hypothetical protein|tara:strand:- start:8064 stop:8738 length:675 start_codon:yes stop_codon:yes gene_type:complete
MKISESTKEVLKNFAEINQNLLINPGKKLSTISTMKNILAKAEIEEEFPQELGIYDMHEFLGTLGLFQKPVLTFDEKNMVINEEGISTSTNYYFSDPSVLVSPTKDIKMPPVDVSFTLTQTDLAKVKKASAVMQLPDITVTAETGGDIFLKAVDSKNSTSNDYKVKVGENAPANFTFHFKAENFKLIDGDYDVEISKSLISHFKHRSKSIEYWIALEQTSKYGG